VVPAVQLYAIDRALVKTVRLLTAEEPTNA
jgi:hypothetical protein